MSLRNKLDTLLIKKKLLTEEQLQKALFYQEAKGGGIIPNFDRRRDD